MATTDEILVTIPQGILRGKKEVSPYDEIYYSFQKIPYAKPPVGELRFKAPQPAEGWTGIRDATKQGPIAPALDFFTGQYEKEETNEDCLFVNVYTREIPKPGKKYPVLAWIHGGGYNFHSGNKDQYSPDYFMSHDIVFVSMNYRLGPLGFLSLQTKECTGNFGLKDMRLALQWIQNNISNFGGDPDNVTVFGESGGGSAVSYLLLSPSCKGLFKRAIAQSGAACNPWGYIKNPREIAYLLGKRLGCDAANDEELLSVLKKASPEDIIIKSAGLISETREERFGEKLLSFSFAPTTESESEEAFITSNPLTGKFQLDVPFITGVTDKEMIMMIYDPKDIPDWKEDKDFQDFVPRTLNLERDSELSLKIARKIREFFFKDGITLDRLIDAASDVYFNHGVHLAKKQRIKDPSVKSPTYGYKFTYEGKSSIPKELLSKISGVPNETKGISHGEDMMYLFISKTLAPTPIEKGTADYNMMLRLVQLWINFATTGNPTNEHSEIDWQPTKNTEDVYLDIGKDLQLKKGFFKERMEFWDEIFKLAGYEG